VILEVAVLDVRAGSEAAYEAAFQQASSIISSMPGYISHQLQRCIEVPNRYILLVNWNSLEAHTVGFRGSPEYQNWKRLLHLFMIRFPLLSTMSRLRRVRPNHAMSGRNGGPSY
jgi:heme-degrading monooxygenase HmoA